MGLEFVTIGLEFVYITPNITNRHSEGNEF